MGKRVSLLLVGVGGYGNHYVKELLNNMDNNRFAIAGAVDPEPSGCMYLKELSEIGIPFFKTIEEFYSKNTADLAIIASPIHFHSYQSCYAMTHGSNVLCEKPVSATVQEALKMRETSEVTGKFLAIGYQWSYSDAILNLKNDVMKGEFGKPLRLKTVVLWPRDGKYYSRKWAAKKKDEFGNWILDSIAANACAHYLHNMFFVLGEKVDLSIYPKELKAELYRANDIENFDTVSARIMAMNDTVIMFHASHAVNESIGPIFHYEFEEAVVSYSAGMENNNLFAKLSNGRVKNYGNPNENEIKKLWVCIDAAAGLNINIPCKVETAIPHIICVNGMQESVPEIVKFPKSLIKKDESRDLIWVDGLKETLLRCYEDWTLPSESDVQWARAGKHVNLVDYKYFGG